MKCQVISLALALLLALTAPAGAQFTQDPYDQGAADTVPFVFTQLPDATTGQRDVEVQLWVANDAQVLSSMACGFRWVNPNLRMDSAKFSPEALAAFDFIRILYRNNNRDSTNAHDEFVCVAGRLFGPGLPSGPRKHVATYWFTLTSWTVMDSLVIDTARVGAAAFALVDVANAEYRPFWPGPYVVYDTARPEISHLILSEDTLEFAAVQGSSAPPAQQFSITSDNLPLSFDLTESAAWLLKAPSSGTTPATINVSVSLTGLLPGTYFDSIRVQSASAGNSPQFLYVRFVLSPPPPSIGVSPQALYFNALAGGSNPPSQILYISNLGGPTLEWSVTNDQSWLSLDPVFGTEDGQVTVSVDITGLSYGAFLDTIRVEDPEATNSPVKVPVQLTVASDLPLIEVDEQIIYRTIDINSSHTFDQYFEVRNGGGGSLAFTVTPNLYGAILAVNPVTSTAPDTIKVTFRFEQWVDAYEIDTVWITSPDALNSPFQVIFHQRVVINPATIDFSQDTAVLNVYECSQGFGQSMPQAEVMILNTGDDDPMFVEFSYESDLFEVVYPPMSIEEADVPMRVQALENDLPLGTYYDSVKIWARWAINKPQYLTIQYNKLAGDELPEIIVAPPSLTIPYQEDTGPITWIDFAIHNLHGGCMPWQIQESLDWLTPVEPSGGVPDPSPLLIDPEGYTLGEYGGVVSIVSEGAVNSPLNVPVALQVWRLHGDWNWNGLVTIQDISLAVDFVFMEGSPPLPTAEVGDCNCDDGITVGDISAMIDYLFISLEPLCGNPY